jgi:hypothetical protein
VRLAAAVAELTSLAAQMKIKRLGLFCGAVGVVILIAAIWLFHPNDLGLTGFDVLLGGRPEPEALRTNTKAAADLFLAQHKTQLMGESDKNYELALDYSKSSKIRSLGYRSSFYYYCWDVYLPYSLRTDASDNGIVIVQLSDAIPDHRHDPQTFHVIRAMLLDNQGKVIKQIDQPR